jgi:hypothetical protein
MISWDTESFFSDCLSMFGLALERLAGKDADDGLSQLIAIARVGFHAAAEVTPPWNDNLERYMREMLTDGELCEDNMTLFDECPGGARLFESFVYGCLLGKYAVRELNSPELFLGRCHLLSYTISKVRDIRRIYERSTQGG